MDFVHVMFYNIVKQTFQKEEHPHSQLDHLTQPWFSPRGMVARQPDHAHRDYDSNSSHY